MTFCFLSLHTKTKVLQHVPRINISIWHLKFDIWHMSLLSIDMKTKVVQNIQTFIHSWFPASVWRSDIFLPNIIITSDCDKRGHRAGSLLKKSLNVRQKLGTRNVWMFECSEQLLFSCVSSKVSICNYVTCRMSHVICQMLMLIVGTCWTIFVFISRLKSRCL